MVTDDDREFAKRHSRNIVAYRRQRGMKSMKFAGQFSDEEVFRRGILTECAFANAFGLPMDEIVSEYGDGGYDFRLPLCSGTVLLNVKSKSVRASFAGLIKSGTHLRVPKSQLRPGTIYVFGIYLEMGDNAQVLRWAWGRDIVNGGKTMAFDNDGEDAYVRRYEECELLDVLKKMCKK